MLHPTKFRKTRVHQIDFNFEKKKLLNNEWCLFEPHVFLVVFGFIHISMTRMSATRLVLALFFWRMAVSHSCDVVDMLKWRRPLSGISHLASTCLFIQRTRLTTFWYLETHCEQTCVLLIKNWVHFLTLHVHTAQLVEWSGGSKRVWSFVWAVVRFLSRRL